jgi:hypothetical protein
LTTTWIADTGQLLISFIMKNNLIKLNETQSKELQEIAKVLCSHFKIEKIICFGALSALSSENTIFSASSTQSANSYYLLVLTTEITRIEHVMQDYIKRSYPGTFILQHGLETVMNLVFNYDTFFLNACLNGALIYTADGFTMIPEFEEEKMEEAVIKDQEAFKRIYVLASGFLESASFAWKIILITM